MALVGESSSERIGSIDALIMRSNLPCRTCSIILSEIRDSFILGQRKDDLSDLALGATQLNLTVSARDRKNPMRIKIVADEEDLALGELVLSVTDPGMPLLPPMVPHEMSRETLFRKPCWAAENATAFSELTALWVGAYIAAWLSRCKEDHGESCNRHFGTDLPTRLIHIQEDGTLKLVDTAWFTAEERASLSYATVSHVWGLSQMLKLETTNIESFRSVIPLGSLARKFREVIRLATTIGIRYVWIDTLCIIQNSRDDWLQEGGRMATVYQSATINFAPVGGSATDVCLTGRNVYGLYRRTIHLMHPIQGPITVYLSPSNRVVWRMFNLPNEQPPLFKRGWIWQERYLSRRTVYLGETQLAWECGKCLWLESSGFQDHSDKLALLAYRKGTLHGPFNKNWTSFRPGVDDPKGVAKWKSHWDGFGAGYTAAALTFTTDKLAAMAGIATAFQEASGHQYVAGMWKEQIPQGSLLWKAELIEEPRQQSVRPKTAAKTPVRAGD
ncbi:hypothetical protein NEMBOFW57_001361 [Staphylotrichum longicolle]|uniref:Heterokaryon incompatibility domain-containing protein n=1 Tax=Staphylotrichum longicolle TaxID=669026 RepID=A0AAD4I1M7_9PEZI|nr:hypothetical protein NEMBOFW57_001361 [Staphylotrichum longicolle]